MPETTRRQRLGAWLRCNTDYVVLASAAVVVVVLSFADVLSRDAVNTAYAGGVGGVDVDTRGDRDALRSRDRELQDSIRAAVDSEVVVITPSEIGVVLAQSLQQAQSWSFKGGTGSWTRSTTLPEMAKRAHSDHRRYQVHLELVDPTNDDSCAIYADLRRRYEPVAMSRATSDWDVRTLRIELLATIVSAVWHAQHRPLDVNLSFSTAISAIRFDMSPEMILLTSPARDFRALEVRQGNIFNALAEELRLSFESGRVFRNDDLGAAPLSYPAEDVTTDEIRRLLDEIHVMPGEFGESELDAGRNQAFSGANPYT